MPLPGSRAREIVNLIGGPVVKPLVTPPLIIEIEIDT